MEIKQYYKQTKQRVELDINFSSAQTECQTELIFELERDLKLEEILIQESMETYVLLHCFNININSINLNTSELSNSSLEYIYLPGSEEQNYASNLYKDISDHESFNNVNRVDFDFNETGNLKILIPKELLSNKPQGNNALESWKLPDSFSILISYHLNDTLTGLIFQEFFDEKIDSNFQICYTPNFYFNTCNWVPCEYNLKNFLCWTLVLIVSEFHNAYANQQLKTIQSDGKKRAYIYETIEPTLPKNLGFAVVPETVFVRVPDINNKFICYIVNESHRERIEKSLIYNGVTSAIYNFYEEFFETDISLNCNSITFILIIPYLTVSLSGSLDSNVKQEHYFNMIKYPNLYIMPDKFVFTENIPELVDFQLRGLAKLFITNFIGGLINEAEYADFWLICGLENWLVYCFMQKCYGNTYSKNIFIQGIRKYKKLVQAGVEKRPLYSMMFSHPIELQMDYVLYLKSLLVLLLLETHVEKVYLQKALKNIINDRHKNGSSLSTENFIRIFRKNCGINLKRFMNLWIVKTGMLELDVYYRYNESNNSIDLEFHQKPTGMRHFTENPFLEIPGLDKNLKIKVPVRKDNDDTKSYKQVPVEVPIVNFKLKSIRFFDINLGLVIYQTNGFEIVKETYSIKLNSDRSKEYYNYPLITKIRKNPIKKREQEFIQELISNTNVTKIYNNEEIERILTQHSILWISVDSDITALRTVNIIQDSSILFDYIRLFKDTDIVGQYETLRNIYSKKESHHNSLIILETFIKTSQMIFFQLRIYALQLYVRIIHESRHEEGYLFLIEYFEDILGEILKNKTSLNRELYFILKKVIRYLGNYKEENFNEFKIIGRVKVSSIQHKIIDKFLIMLLSNDFNTISGLNDTYIMREILIGCSKLHLQEKNVYLLRKILKYLRIEKLKRSFNEIIIISCIEAYLNLLLKNGFFVNEKKNDPFFKNLINEINDELNFYLSSNCERFELIVYLNYFVIFVIFYKSLNFTEFLAEIESYCDPSTEREAPDRSKNTQDAENEDIEIEYSYARNTYCTFLAKYVAQANFLEYLYSLLSGILSKHEQGEDKDEKEGINERTHTMKNGRLIYNHIMKVLKSQYCYRRIDLRNIFYKLADKFSVFVPESTSGDSFRLFAGKKYADEDWLYSFVNADKVNQNKEDSDNEDGNKSDGQSMRTNEAGVSGTKALFKLLKRYQIKYQNDLFVINNYNLQLANYSEQDCMKLIISKVLEHPLSEHFSYELNEENLGDLYKSYVKTIKNPIDLTIIEKNVNERKYPAIKDFVSDIRLLFSNCREFNNKKSVVYEAACQLEDFFNILYEPIKKRSFDNADVKVNLNDIQSIRDNVDNIDNSILGEI